MKIHRNEKTVGLESAIDHGRFKKCWDSLRAARIRWCGAWMDSKEFLKVWHKKSWCRMASLRITRQT